MTTIETSWDELTSRRQELLQTAEQQFGNETFAAGELNRHLVTNTTTQTLNKVATEDGYLRRYPGGSSMLMAEVPRHDSEAAFHAAAQERLAKKMVDREGLPLDALKVDWTDPEERENFVSMFNERSQAVELEATWTRNKYRLKDSARIIVQSN